MSNESTTPSAPKASADLDQVRVAYAHWAQVAVDQYNKKGEMPPTMIGVKFTESGGLLCTMMDPPYVAMTLESPNGPVELTRFARTLLTDPEMRSSMQKQGLTPADAVVFISEIALKANSINPVVPQKEAILVVVHTTEGMHRGLNPIALEPAKQASVGPLLEEDPTAVTALSPQIDPVAQEVVRTRQHHDIYHPSSILQ